jgi:predicted dienelactone hydrolase
METPPKSEQIKETVPTNATVVCDVYRSTDALSIRWGNNAHVYYPSVDEGKSVYGEDLIVVGFCHGTAIDVSNYEYMIYSWVATGKFIVVANTFPYDGLVNMGTFGINTATYIKTCMDVGDDHPPQPAWLAGKVRQSEYKLVGHSLGGGAAVYTAYHLPNCSGLMAICPAQDLNLPIKDTINDIINKVTCPAFFLSGSCDSVVPSADVFALYEPLASDDKGYGVMKGATHSNFTNPRSEISALAEAAAALMKPPSDAMIPIEQQSSAAIQLSRAFLENCNAIVPYIKSPESSFVGDAISTEFSDFNLQGSFN